jgi:ATP-dependent Clp protease ATP-binding subunit ClpC
MRYSLRALWNWAFGNRRADADASIYSRFTDRTRKVLQLANQSARKWGHESVGTEHILLGLVEEGSGVAAHVLKTLVGSIERVRAATEAAMEPGPGVAPNGRLPQSPQAKKVIELSIDEARRLNHKYVGTEHILLALLRESEGRVAGVFAALGLDHERVRQKILAVLSGGLNA